MIGGGNIEGYERLCAAVIKQAAQDYRQALVKLQRKPNDEEALETKADCERFFQNEIALYSDLDGEMIMRKIQEQAGGGKQWRKRFLTDTRKT